MHTTRLDQQLRFIIEIDKLKGIVRRSYLMDTSRRENSAEHSWHLAMMAIILAEHADEPINLLHVIKMVLVHDLVEIDAGDTYIYDAQANNDKVGREQQAAERIFSLLPAEQAREIHTLWNEFEARATPEARFAAVLDRLMPLMHNFYTEGRSWQEHGITVDQIMQRTESVRESSQTLWEVAYALIEEAHQRGYLGQSPGQE